MLLHWSGAVLCEGRSAIRMPSPWVSADSGRMVRTTYTSPGMYWAFRHFLTNANSTIRDDLRFNHHLYATKIVGNGFTYWFAFALLFAGVGHGNLFEVCFQLLGETLPQGQRKWAGSVGIKRSLLRPKSWRRRYACHKFSLWQGYPFHHQFIFLVNELFVCGF